MQRFLGNTKLSGYECMMQALPYSHERDKEAERMRNRYKRKLNEMIDEENLSLIRQRIMKAMREMLFDTFSFKDFDHKIKFYSSYNQLAKLIGKGNIKNENLAVIYLLSSMQTICSTGIRVSELKFITVEAVNAGQADIRCKGKMRVIILPKRLCIMLKDYLKAQNIKSGSVFVTKTGKPLDRSNIWADMKKLCESAGVSKNKVFPHNLRHLFARTFYTLQKDIVRLADILGHSSVNTTRIYTVESGDIHRQQIQRLGLLRC